MLLPWHGDRNDGDAPVGELRCTYAIHPCKALSDGSNPRCPRNSIIHPKVSSQKSGAEKMDHVTAFLLALLPISNHYFVRSLS